MEYTCRNDSMKCSRRMVLDFRQGVGNILDRLRLIQGDSGKQQQQVEHLTVRQSAISSSANTAAPYTHDQALRLFQAVARKFSQLKTITVADLDQRPHFPLSCLDVLLRKCSCLTTLKLDAISFQGTDKESKMLAGAFRQHPTLQDVCLSGLYLAPGGSSHHESVCTAPAIIANALSQLSSLQSIEIVETSIPPFWTGESLAELCTSNSLKVLRIRGVRFMGDEDIALMAQALDANHSSTMLQELWILSCELGYAGNGPLALAQMLQRNTSLQILGLNRLSFSEHAIIIAQGLKDNQTLRGLHLCLRDGPDRCICETYAQLLENHNYGLESMSGSGFLRASASTTAGSHEKHCSSVEAVSQIDFYLRLNRNGRRFLMQNDDHIVTLDDWIDALCHQNEDVSALFYWLSRNPSLCSAD